MEFEHGQSTELRREVMGPVLREVELMQQYVGDEAASNDARQAQLILSLVQLTAALSTGLDELVGYVEQLEAEHRSAIAACVEALDSA